MNELITVQIRSHLIPFFYEEMEGTMASYNGQKVKMIRLLPSSTLANYIYTQIGYEKNKNSKLSYDNFLIYLSIQSKNFDILSGTIYIDKNGVKSELQMTIEQSRDLNNLLEDIFRTSMVFFINGCKIGGVSVVDAINIFMEEYNFFEYGFEHETFRKMYYEQKKKLALNRFQKRASNQVKGYM